MKLLTAKLTVILFGFAIALRIKARQLLVVR